MGDAKNIQDDSCSQLTYALIKNLTLGEKYSHMCLTPNGQSRLKCAGIQKETTIALDWNIILYYDISQVFTGGLPFHNRHLVTTHTVKGHVNSY